MIRWEQTLLIQARANCRSQTGRGLDRLRGKSRGVTALVRYPLRLLTLQQARRLSRQLTEAVTSRDTIAAATGVLLARGAVSRQDAFVALAAAARESGRPVDDVARAMLAALTARNCNATGS